MRSVGLVGVLRGPRSVVTILSVPEHRTPALILRTFDQGESDRLVHLYTEALGRVSAIAKGARRSRRRFPGTLEILTVVNAHLIDRPRSSLARLEGVTLIRSFEPLVSDLGRYAIACELLEILDRFTGEREASPELFRFATGVLEVVGEERPDRLLGLLVLAKTLARLGYRPGLVSCTACGRSLTSRRERVGFAPRHGGAVCRSCCTPEDTRVSVRVLAALEAGLRQPLRERSGLGLGRADVLLAEMLLDRFVRFHLGAQVRTCAFLRTILSAESLDEGRVARNTAAGPGERRPGAPQGGVARAAPPPRGS
jgi:DNA repair protein RecO (recombination protein O)